MERFDDAALLLEELKTTFSSRKSESESSRRVQLKMLGLIDNQRLLLLGRVRSTGKAPHNRHLFDTWRSGERPSGTIAEHLFV